MNSDLPQKETPRVFSRLVSWPGVVTSIFFFVISLLPSMLPRSGLIQGAISGITIAIGYGVGALFGWAWNYLEIPHLTGRAWGWIRIGLYLLLGWIVVAGMWLFVGRQNNIRDVFGMERIGPAVWLTLIPVAVLVAALLIITSRSIRRLMHVITRWLDRSLPARLSRVLGGVAIVAILWGLWSGVLVNGFFAGANQIFEPRDNTTHDFVSPTDSELRSSGEGSLVEWDTLGRQGRRFVATGPTVDELNEFWGEGAVEPIRVYAGLKSAETLEERAKLVLDELIRTNAFDRSAIVVATTTGTGFLEPNAMISLEYVHAGDVATVGVQYSYLPSWISILADQEKVKETSRVVFDTIHGYWSELPEDDRPRIYIYGLSLGSFGVESILTSIDIINEPINGAVMVGPPFVNPLHDQILDDRDAGSSPSAAIYEDGRTVRFTNEENLLDVPTADWGDTKIAYLQHASDAVVFFEPDLAFSSPDWLLPDQRGPEITDDFVWFPLVTFWQVLMDMANAGAVPEGFGHEYTKQANADVWMAVTAPDLDDEVVAELRQHMIDLGPFEEG